MAVKTTASTGGIKITNLTAFRSALRASIAGSPRELSAALKKTGPPVILRTRALASASHQTGALEGGYKVSVARNRATLVNAQPYAGGAEWGQHGKWAGFAKYGGPGRFAWKAVEENQELIGEIILSEMRDIIEIHGWAR